MKKIISIFTIAIVIFAATVNSVYAISDIKGGLKVPFNAEPNTTYIVTEDGEMEVLYQYIPKGVYSRDSLLNAINKSSYKEYEENKIFEGTEEAAKELPEYIYEFCVVAYPGDEIIFDSNGEFLNIIQSVSSGKALNSYSLNAIDYGTVKKGTHYYPSSTKANKLVITDSSVTGTGYGTNYTYKSNGNSDLGQRNHTLVKGDCATARDYDNAICGTIIGVRNLDNDVREDFEKWDIGSLHNAVIDIWWKGLPMLGIDTTNWQERDYNNCRFSARYWYEF